MFNYPVPFMGDEEGSEMESVLCHFSAYYYLLTTVDRQRRSVLSCGGEWRIWRLAPGQINSLQGRGGLMECRRRDGRGSQIRCPVPCPRR